MVTVYCPIEQLQKLATSANIPYSSAQILEFRLTIVRGTQDFEKGISNWISKQLNNKTCDNFKTHFSEAHAKLKAIRGPTMQQAGCHHANMLARQLKATISTQGNKMLKMIQAIQLD